MRAGSERSGEGRWGTWEGTVRVVVRADWLELRVEGGLARSPTCWAPLTNPRAYQGPASLSQPTWVLQTPERMERLGKKGLESLKWKR